jgi:uncharacterized protein (TIGR04141 family)
MRLRQFNFLLLKADITDASDALRTDQEYETLTLADGGTLAIKPRMSNPPWWVDYLRPHVRNPQPLQDLYNASNSAVLFVRASGRIFAVTFGYGRNLLDPVTFERDFGLKVVLNTVAPDQLKSVDARTFEDLTVHTRRDVSQASPIEAFGLNVSRDLVRAVTGTPRDESLARQVTGSDALSLRSRAQVPDLPALCARLLEAYQSDAYKERFGWVDRLRPVKDPAAVSELNDVLVRAIRERAIDDLHMAPPEPLDWARIEGFRLSTERSDAEPHSDPSISAYLDSLDHPEEIDIERLKRDRVMAVGSDQGELYETWSVYRCLVFEAQLHQRLYALSSGDWFSIEKSFADEVTEFAANLPVLDIQLPDAPLGVTEPQYNAGVPNTVDLLCMDGELVRVSGRDPIELCDLLSRDKRFIHVKLRGASSTLSHLFQQGLVSAELLFRDHPFRTEARNTVDALDNSFTPSVPANRPAPRECEVSYVVITRSDRGTPLTLPFFALVALRTAVLQLQDWGYKVSVRAVKQQ